MTYTQELPLPVLDALPLGAHRLMVLTDEALFQSCGVRIAYTGKEGGVSEGPFASLNCSPYIGDDMECIMRNQRIACEALDAAQAPLLTARQVHGTDFAWVPSDYSADDVLKLCGEEVDGFLVERPNTVALLLAADCPLIIVVSPTGRYVLAHAGWRGAIAGMASKAVCQLARIDSCAPSCFNAYIGPHLCTECFEVGEEVSEAFREEFGDSCVPDQRHVSLQAAITADLMRAGIDPRRIAGASRCTKCQSNLYYSYRATGGACGRHAAIAVRMLK